MIRNPFRGPWPETISHDFFNDLKQDLILVAITSKITIDNAALLSEADLLEAKLSKKYMV